MTLWSYALAMRGCTTFRIWTILGIAFAHEFWFITQMAARKFFLYQLSLEIFRTFNNRPLVNQKSAWFLTEISAIRVFRSSLRAFTYLWGVKFKFEKKYSHPFNRQMFPFLIDLTVACSPDIVAFQCRHLWNASILGVQPTVNVSY